MSISLQSLSDELIIHISLYLTHPYLLRVNKGISSLVRLPHHSYIADKHPRLLKRYIQSKGSEIGPLSLNPDYKTSTIYPEFYNEYIYTCDFEILYLSGIKIFYLCEVDTYNDEFIAQVKSVMDTNTSHFDIVTTSPISTELITPSLVYASDIPSDLDLSTCDACVNLTAIPINSFESYETLSIKFLSKCKSLTSIEPNAFANLTTPIDVSECTCLTRIHSHAFASLTRPLIGLEKCTKIESIDEGAFSELYDVSFLLFPFSNLTYIGEGAFYSLESTYIDLSPCVNLICIGSKAFYNLTIPPDLKGCTNLKEISAFAFYNVTTPPDLKGCTKLERIGERAFYNLTTSLDLKGCTKLEYIGY